MTLRGFIELWEDLCLEEFNLIDYETGAHYCSYITEEGEECWELGGDEIDATCEILLSKEVMMLSRDHAGDIEIYLD